MPYKECPQCGTWTYSASMLPRWECPECETDMSDIPSQTVLPPGMYEEFSRQRAISEKRQIVVRLKRKQYEGIDY